MRYKQVQKGLIKETRSLINVRLFLNEVYIKNYRSVQKRIEEILEKLRENSNK